MLKILCTDDPDGRGFQLEVMMEGETFKVASQLDSALRDIAKQTPEVIDILTYLQTMKGSLKYKERPENE